MGSHFSLVANKGRFVPVYDITDKTRPDGIRSLRGFDVDSMVFAPTGTRLFVGSYDGTIDIYDLAEPAPDDLELTTLTGLTGVIDSVTFSPDGRHMAAGDWSGTARVWDMTTVEGPRVVTTVRAPGAINTVSFAPDGKTLPRVRNIPACSEASPCASQSTNCGERDDTWLAITSTWPVCRSLAGTL